MTGRGRRRYRRRMNTGSVRREAGGALAIAAVTAGWLAGLGWLGWQYFVLVLKADDDAPPDPRLERLWLLGIVVLIGGPLVVAGLARTLRLGGVARAYLVIALILVLPAAYGVLILLRPAPAPPAPPQTPATNCIAYSGGSNSCPGG